MKLNELLNYIPEWQRVTITGFGISTIYYDNERVSDIKLNYGLWDEQAGIGLKNFSIARVWVASEFGDLIIEVVKE